jgi:hypothetical protein
MSAVGIRDFIEGADLATGSGYSVDELVAVAEMRRRSEKDQDTEPIRSQEYAAILHGSVETADAEFVCEPGVVDESLAPVLASVMLAKRIREVRVLESFTRVRPPSPADSKERRAALADSRQGWLPGIEVLGEGVFLQLRTDLLAEWESRKVVVDRARRLDKQYRARFERSGTEPDRTVTPRLIAIHTLSHAIIGQWALDCGYPAASLRERLYVDDEMCGLLVYTATSDSAGSLGGVVRLAEQKRLVGTVREALARVSWCSSDPVCVETRGGGVDGLNLAACHSCVLLPEVSCEEANVLLDRAMLIGTPEDSDLGLFSTFLTKE